MSETGLKGTHLAPRASRANMETLVITPKTLDALKKPPFQRPLRVNAKVLALVKEIVADEGLVPGIITLGVFKGERYILDGQHRLEAFKIAGLEEGLADVRVKTFEEMADMGEEFVRLNSSFVKMRPDDILRGLEMSTQGLKILRSLCPFIGYNQIKKDGSGSAPVLSMVVALRVFYSAKAQTPGRTGGGAGYNSASDLAKRITVEDSEEAAKFYNLCREAWQGDKQNYSLWTMLNLTMCMWIYNNTVLGRYSPKTVKVNEKQFSKFLMAVSADATYGDWIVGRLMRDRDRAPCYVRLKKIMVRRLQSEFVERMMLPQPDWANG